MVKEEGPRKLTWVMSQLVPEVSVDILEWGFIKEIFRSVNTSLTHGRMCIRW